MLCGVQSFKENKPPPEKMLKHKFRKQCPKPTLYEVRVTLSIKALTMFSRMCWYVSCAPLFSEVLSLYRSARRTRRMRKAQKCCVTQRGVSGSINFSIQNSTQKRRVAAKTFSASFPQKIHKNERTECKY